VSSQRPTALKRRSAPPRRARPPPHPGLASSSSFPALVRRAAPPRRSPARHARGSSSLLRASPPRLLQTLDRPPGVGTLPAHPPPALWELCPPRHLPNRPPLPAGARRRLPWRAAPAGTLRRAACRAAAEPAAPLRGLLCITPPFPISFRSDFRTAARTSCASERERERERVVKLCCILLGVRSACMRLRRAEPVRVHCRKCPLDPTRASDSRVSSPAGLPSALRSGWACRNTPSRPP